MISAKERPTIKWDENGLVPVILQDAKTGQVLTLAYANEEALHKTEEIGQTVLWSRSRQELWHKGATSGNTQDVVEIRVDCDGDAILYRVLPAGPACHTGATTCFYRSLASDGGQHDEAPMLHRLESIVADRKAHPHPGSYTSQLLDAGEDEIAKKVGEEAIEVIVATKGESKARVVYELADLMYHIFVLMAQKDISWTDVEAELARRFKGRRHNGDD